MKLTRKGWFAVGLTAVCLASAAYAAGNYETYPQVGQPSFCASTVTGAGNLGGATGQGQAGTGSVCAQTVPAGPPFLTGAEIVPADTGAASGSSPATVTMSVTALGNFWATPRNYLDNGSLNITNTNGTGAVTCAQNAAVAVASLSADRWGCQANVAVGAGRSQIITASPTPPTGFTNAMKVWRNSAALTQPVCVIQEVTSQKSIELAGQTVTFSAYLAALAGLAADNNNVVNLVLISGTGTDQGLTTAPTASPAITPAWTGITTIINQPITITTTFARYAVTASIPATATEVGAMLCFTPTATGAGATDGFAFTGAQLERSSVASNYEFRPKGIDQTLALQQFYKLAENGGAGNVVATGFTSTTSLAEGLLNFPVQMYTTPTMGYTAGFGACSAIACTANTNCTAIRTSTLQTFTVNQVNAPIECTSSGGFATAGSGTYLLFTTQQTGVITAWTGL